MSIQKRTCYVCFGTGQVLGIGFCGPKPTGCFMCKGTGHVDVLVVTLFASPTEMQKLATRSILTGDDKIYDALCSEMGRVMP